VRPPLPGADARSAPGKVVADLGSRCDHGGEGGIRSAPKRILAIVKGLRHNVFFDKHIRIHWASPVVPRSHCAQSSCRHSIGTPGCAVEQATQLSAVADQTRMRTNGGLRRRPQSCRDSKEEGSTTSPSQIRIAAPVHPGAPWPRGPIGTGRTTASPCL